MQDEGAVVTERRLPLAKRFPGKTVARFKVWFSGHTLGIDGPIPDELARLIVVVWSNPDPAALAKVQALGVELQKPKANSSKSSKDSDRAVRQELSKKRAAGSIGRKT